VDSTALLFTLGLSLLTGIIFGMAPAWQLSRTGFIETLKRRRSRTRGALVVAEIAISLVLVVGAGLLIRSFVLLRSVDPGFRADNLMSMSLDLPSARYNSAEKIVAFHRDTLDRLRSLPGAASAASVNWLPFGNMVIAGDIAVEGRPIRPEERIIPIKAAISPGYFRTMGIQMLEGREFETRDDQSAPGVAIVGAKLAKRLWPNESPLGRRIATDDRARPEDMLTIVGVASDIRQRDLSTPAPMFLYTPYSQVKRRFWISHMTYIVRAQGDPKALAPAMRSAVLGVDKEQPVQAQVTLAELISGSIDEPRFRTRLLSGFAGLALLLAAVGIYGVMASAVAERTREIGIRMALGAQLADVLRNVFRRSAVLLAAGIAIGGAGAFLLTRLLKDFLFQVTPEDPLTFIGAAAVLALAAALATIIPARRAAQIAPSEALRYE
jgi:putative ABC transport system permease protein